MWSELESMSRTAQFRWLLLAVGLSAAVAACGGSDEQVTEISDNVDVSATLEAELNALEYQNLAWKCGLDESVALPESDEVKDVLGTICNSRAFASLWSPVDAPCISEVIVDGWTGTGDFSEQLYMYVSKDFATKENVTLAGEAYDAVISASVECLDARTVVIWYDEKVIGYSAEEASCRADLVGDVLDDVWPALLLYGFSDDTEVTKAAVIAHADADGVC